MKGTKLIASKEARINTIGRYIANHATNEEATVSLFEGIESLSVNFIAACVVVLPALTEQHAFVSSRSIVLSVVILQSM